VNILALDLGTTTGWAYREGARIESGVQTFDVKRGESPGMRYVRFNRWLDEMMRLRRGALLVFEQAHHRGGAATEVAAGFSTRVLECAARLDLEHAAVHTATLKKFATGKGNAKKAEMLGAVCRRWKAVTDDNEADAIALLYYAIAEIVEPTPDENW
jgi:Holliday junction resolvasome RuvABC endonuclease subunit